MRLSVVDRMMKLPEIFTVGTFVRMTGLDINSAAVYLSRWASAGAVAATGPKSGTYYNLVKNRNAQNDLLTDAIKMEYPSATLIGESVLHAAGWITQIPSELSIGVVQRRSYQKIYGALIYGRSLDWFNDVSDAIVNPDQTDISTYGFRSLTPAMALADMCGQSNGWIPDIDDLYLEPSDWNDVGTAMSKLNIEIPEQYLSQIDQVLELRPKMRR